MSRRNPSLPSLRQLSNIAKRCQAILPQFQAHGPLVYDRVRDRWINAMDDLEAHALAFDLMRLQRGPKLQEAGEPRRVVYVRVGDEDYLETPTTRYPLATEGLGVLEVMLEILEAER